MLDKFTLLVLLLILFVLTTMSTKVSSLVQFPSNCKCTGGKPNDIWDNKCLNKHLDLKDLIRDYKRKKVGKKLREFLEWYKPSISSSCIIKYLICNNFKMTSSRLQSDGYYINSIGEKTNTVKHGVPHFIFIHQDRSCLRLKPIIGGLRHSHTPFPTISFSVVYDPDDPTFYNEAFKVSRNGEPIPKAGLRHPDACINPKLSNFSINELMKSTHLKLPKPSLEDVQFFRNFMFNK